MTDPNPDHPSGDTQAGHDTDHEPRRLEQDRRAVRQLILNAFAALSPEAREYVLMGNDDDPEGTRL